MIPAVRTVSETDDVRVIEGLAFPFKGRDTYGTFFSARTNFEWGLFADVVPSSTRAGDDAKFVRPATFHHGFDPDFRLTDDNGVRVGGWSPVRMDADGVWVRSQLDKRHAYYETRLKPLLDANALGLSGGSAEHSVRIDQKTGEILDWPAYEVALTPVESNPLAQLSVRAGEAVAVLRVASEQPEAVRAIQTFSDIVAAAEMNEELPAAFDTLSSAIYGAIYATDRDFNPMPAADKQAAIETSLDQFRDFIVAKLDELASREQPRSGFRAGARNSSTDQGRIQRIHDLADELGADCPPGDGAGDTEDTSDDAQRASKPPTTPDGDSQPATMTFAVRQDPDAAFEELRKALATRAAEAGAAVARKLTS